MWCSNCQQDVPVIASGDDLACCARCGRAAELGDSHMETASAEAISEMSEWGLELDGAPAESPTAVAAPPDVSGEDWLLDEEFRRLQSRFGKNSNPLHLAEAKSSNPSGSQLGALVQWRNHNPFPLRRPPPRGAAIRWSPG